MIEKDNVCPQCGPVADQFSSVYCKSHLQAMREEWDRAMPGWRERLRASYNHESVTHLQHQEAFDVLERDRMPLKRSLAMQEDRYITRIWNRVFPANNRRGRL